MKVEIRHKTTGSVLYTAEIQAEYENASRAVQLGMAVIAAVKEGANLGDAYLGDANLRDSYLRGADLRDSYLGGADLRGAYLGDANLRDSYLRGADLRGADLRGANLRGTNLRGANLGGAKGLHFQIPDGSLIGWKKAGGKIVKLRIPERARRTACPTGRKCRAEMAEVVWVQGGKPVKSERGCTYEAGREVWPDRYDDDWRLEYSQPV